MYGRNHRREKIIAPSSTCTGAHFRSAADRVLLQYAIAWYALFVSDFCISAPACATDEASVKI